MAKRIYVGNLPWSCSTSDLEAMFGAHGEVTAAEVINDRVTGKSRGFGFVQMASDDAANAAMNALNGTEMAGRALVVNEARERAPRSGGGGGGGYGGGRGRYDRD
jgi:RNA recognition motif-containing protein